MNVSFYKEQLCGAISPHQGLSTWLASRARDSSLPISIAMFTQWLTACSHSVWIWGISGITLVILQSLQRPSASGRSSPRTGGKHSSSCRLSTCLRCPYTLGTADARLWPYTHFNGVNIAPGPSQLPPEPAHTLPSLPSPMCGTAACGEHKEIHMRFGNLENTFIWVIFVRLGTISPKTAYNQIHNSDFINIEVTLNDCVKLWSSSETIFSKRCSGTR